MKSKTPDLAVDKTRKADRDLYKQEMQDILLNYPNLRVVEASVEDIILDGSEKVQGIQVQDGIQHYHF